ncbi:MAG: tetratricopeptide repeat protein, partial [Ferruginibacter sp.]
LLVFLISILTFLKPVAQDVNAIVKEADRLEAIPDELAALSKFKEALRVKPIHLHALSKSSELCSRIGQRQTNTKLRDDYYKAAKVYAETALMVDSTNSEANTSMAIMLGRSTLTKSGKEKVASAKDLKKHVDAAIKSDPNNFLAWHVLGRWHYEISNLNMIERAAVKVFYGGFPASSLKEGIKAFEKTKALAPGFILNYVELAKAYHRNNQKDKAKILLNEMMLLPNHTQDDPTIKETGKKLLEDWK